MLKHNVSLAEAVADESELSSFGKIKFFREQELCVTEKQAIDFASC
jgi:hypothetical protein